MLATDIYFKMPTIAELNILKYVDKEESKKVRIISDASANWKEITNLICSDANRVKSLEQHYKDPIDCLRQAFLENFINKPPQKYTRDWNGLIEVLDDAGLEKLAGDVKHALPYI